jgi:transketolase
VALLLTRQDVPVLAPELVADGVSRGGYVLSATAAEPVVALVATGSEVSVALAAQAELAREGIAAQVVSMPSWELFESQDDRYRRTVLPPEVPSVSLEAGVSQGWSRWTDTSVSIERFGASAPGTQALSQLGIAAARVVESAKALPARLA